MELKREVERPETYSPFGAYLRILDRNRELHAENQRLRARLAAEAWWVAVATAFGLFGMLF